MQDDRATIQTNSLKFFSSLEAERSDPAKQMGASAALTSEAADKSSSAQLIWCCEVPVHDELNMAMQDALEDLDSNHGTESGEFDTALQDALDGSDKNQLTESDEVGLEPEEWNGVINSMMMNV